MSIFLILVAVAVIAFAAGIGVGIIFATGGLAALRERMEVQRLKRRLEREKRKFKLVGRMSANYESWLFGAHMGHSKAFAYFYENAHGERKVETTESDMRELPEVVYFLAGKPLAEIEALALGKVAKAA